MAFYLIDKPVGITSFDVVRILRKKLEIKKIGHSGTLDPLASGLLLVATGESTRLLEYCVGHDKRYRATILLDANSETCDREGPIEYLEFGDSFVPPTLDQIQALLDAKYTGSIAQIPPKYSAIKVDGKPLYQRARAGENVIVPKREVEIYTRDLQSYDFPELVVDFHVSSGTYIRSLARDIGIDLTGGGYLGTLRRTHIGDVSIDDVLCVHDLDSFDPNQTISYDRIFPNISYLEGLASEQKKSLQNGEKGVSIVEAKQGRYFVLYEDGCRGLVEVRDSGDICVLKNNV